MAVPTLGLRFDGLALSLDLASRDVEPPGGPYRDWLRVTVRAEVPYFRADFSWSVMPDELRTLAAALEELHEAAPGTRPVRFKPVQPNLMLSFAVVTRGAITGSYHFRPDYTQPGTLQGSFRIAQTDLPGVAASIRAFLHEADALAESAPPRRS